MGVIAVYCRNGGAGKTTLAVNLGWASAHLSNQRTLVWDLDPQAIATYLLSPTTDAPQFGAALAFDVGIAQFIRHTSIHNLDLLPSDASLRTVNTLTSGVDRGNRLRILLDQAKRTYSRIIVDCPPGLTPLSDQIILIADLITVPVTLSAVSLRGLTELEADLRRGNGDDSALMPVYTMADRRRASHRAILAENPHFPVIPVAEAVELMGDRKTALGAIAPRSDAARAYASVWRAVELRLSERKEPIASQGQPVTPNRVGR